MTHCDCFSGVVASDGGAFQSLAQDFVAGSESFRVKGRGEDAALDLGWLIEELGDDELEMYL